jgi:hypothetical protein
MRSTSGIFVVVAAILSAALSACSSTIHDSARISGYDTLAIDAKQRLVFFGQDPYTGHPIVCTEPSPDALVAISAALAAQGSATLPTEIPTAGGGAPTAGENTFNAGFGVSSSETAASIAMRTATVQVLRDGYYRLCEGLMNGTIRACEYEKIIRGVDSFIATVMAVDAVGGMQRAPIVAVSGGAVTAAATAVTGSTTQAPGEGSEPPKTPNITVGQITVPVPNANQATAIRNIIAAYINYDEALAPFAETPCV